jgi:hypothetical protein
MMTIAELIEFLEELPQEVEAIVTVEGMVWKAADLAWVINTIPKGVRQE